MALERARGRDLRLGREALIERGLVRSHCPVGPQTDMQSRPACVRCGGQAVKEVAVSPREVCLLTQRRH